jgi:hypothetical protein
MTTFTDDFNRADSSNLGAGWVEVSGDWSIVTNQLSPGAAGGTIILRAATAAATDDNYSQVAITSATVASQGVWCRGDATIANGYLWRNNGTQWDLFAVVGGSFTVIATFAAAAANGDVMKVQAVGSTIKGFVNGVQRASVTDTGVTTGKNFGIRSESVSGVRYDNFSGGDVGGATVNATMALDGGAGTAVATAKRVVYATVTAAGGAGGLAATAGRTVHATAALGGGPGVLDAAGSRTVHAGVALTAASGALAMISSTGEALALPNATVVAKAWLATIDGIPADRVANELPRRADWNGAIDGFVTVLPLIANAELHVPIQHPIVQFDCWGAFGGSTKKPNHGVANDLAERIRQAAEATTWLGVPELELPPGVMPVWLSSVFVVRGVTRVPDDHYAHYSLDVHIGWIERDALAGAVG